MKNVIKILTALATIAGAVYIIATYGEQIVAWAKKILNAMPQCPKAEDAEEEVVIEITEEPETAAVEVTEEAAVEEEILDEPAPEVVVPANEPVAEEADFAE